MTLFPCIGKGIPHSSKNSSACADSHIGPEENYLKCSSTRLKCSFGLSGALFFNHLKKGKNRPFRGHRNAHSIPLAILRGGLIRANINNYCCPVKLKMSCKSSPKPSKHRHRGLFFEKQAPLIKKRRFWWRFRVPFIRDFYPFFFRISHKCNEVDIIHECQTHHGDNLRECAAALDAT